MCLQNLMNFHHCLFKILKKNQNITDGWTHGHTDGKKDGQHENSIPPNKHSLRGGVYSFDYSMEINYSLKLLQNGQSNKRFDPYLKTNEITIKEQQNVPFLSK